jgi:hypothetical protein
MYSVRFCLLVAFAVCVSSTICSAGTMPPGAKVYVQPMDGFGAYVIAALTKKKAPVTIVSDRDKAEFEIGGNAESQKAGWAKIIFAGSVSSHETASINVTDMKTSEIVYAYNVDKTNSARGKQSAAEACAKHIKELIEKKP